MKIAVIVIPKTLENRLVELETRRKNEIIQTIALLRSIKILRIVLEKLGDLLSLELQRKLLLLVRKNCKE